MRFLEAIKDTTGIKPSGPGKKNMSKGATLGVDQVSSNGDYWVITGAFGSGIWMFLKSDVDFYYDTKPLPRRQVNQAGLDLLKEFEGCRLTAYRCPAGIWTIGYGHTGVDVTPGKKITQQQAEKLLRDDLARFEQAVTSAVKVPVTDNQFSALVSFTYNLGEGALLKSSVLRSLNQKNYGGAANSLLLFTKARGQVLPGLIRRRNAEKRLFLS